MVERLSQFQSDRWKLQSQAKTRPQAQYKTQGSFPGSVFCWTCCRVLVWLSAVACLFDASVAKADATVLHALIGEDILQRNVLATQHSAKSVPADQRSDFLKRWIFPNGHRDTFRFNGCFVSASSHTRTLVGQLDSPVLDLLDLAKQQQKLDSLKTEVEGIMPTDALCKRQQAAMLFLIDFAKDARQASASSLEIFVELARKADGVPIDQRWPMLLVLSRAVTVPAFNFLTTELIANFQGGTGPTTALLSKISF